MMVQGGPTMWVVLFAGLLLLGLAVLQVIHRHKRDYTQVLWGGVAVILAVGLVGAISGLWTFDQSLVATDPEDGRTLAAMGTHLVLRNLYLSLAVAFIGTLATGIVSTIFRNAARPSPEDGDGPSPRGEP